MDFTFGIPELWNYMLSLDSVLDQTQTLQILVGFIVILASAVFLTWEMGWKLINKCFEGTEILDIISSALSYFAYMGAGILYYSVILVTYYWIYTNGFTLFDIDTTWWAFALCFLLADKAYYWEHRLAHEVNFFWATHTVHHSSPYMNIAVAYRFGPLDGLVAFLFHIPLVLLGFHPIFVLVVENIHQYYQTILHTDRIGKLGFLEKIFNTPSHHRVHHGSDEKYLDKNYGSVLILWDKMFGTFQAEEEKPTYGIVKPVDTRNPVKVFFHGYQRLAESLLSSRSVGDVMGYLFKEPGWEPEHARKEQERQTELAK